MSSNFISSLYLRNKAVSSVPNLNLGVSVVTAVGIGGFLYNKSQKAQNASTEENAMFETI